MDTFTVGRELLSLSYVMGGIENSCLQHKYSRPIALTARRNCKKSATFSVKKVQVGKDQEKAQSEKDSHSKNQDGKKPN